MKLLHFLSLLFVLFFAGNAFAQAEFQIFSFDLSDTFVSVGPAGSVNVDVDVVIRNIGDTDGSTTVGLVVKDSAGVQKFIASSLSSIPVAVGNTDNHNFTVNVQGNWGPGLYFFYPTVGDGIPSLHAQKFKTLTLFISKPPPVPEFSVLLLPLIAFSVLAFLFFSGKKQF